MYRDKDYLLTQDDLIFNVLGDQHDAGFVTAGLKYANGKKWLDSYHDAARFLRDSFPAYADGKIRVPVDRVQQHLKPQERTRHLLAQQQQASELLTLAIDLVHILAEHCDVPASEIGITDSLLWGTGNESSDVDLVIYGSDVTTRFLTTSHELFQFDDIEHIDQQFVQRPPGVDDRTFEVMLKRKGNQGFYRGTRFSIRGVLTDEELLWAPERKTPFRSAEPRQCELEISGRDDSLLFPVSYDTTSGIPLVSYHIGYEMSFLPGDKVRVTAMHETGDAGERLLVGSVSGHDEVIQWVATD
ncbi:hypothetical protein Pan97_34680 [Bremerella volcania]|uniref:Polymerase nucleotidyl transferase domain-containing protein n=1 Tax=Bremerella volcania TaxID=2527984 RepID=A0A518CB29_9BACT|nr:hypothetical protein [Bremerella volcania]QDU76419.1 hypothetical protein Pan97_34680 [Bremerella volcania]